MKVIPTIESKKFDYSDYNSKNMSSTRLNSPGQKVSFGSWRGGIAKAMDGIERRGFFTEFLIVDLLSMIVPRVWIGLNRDREKTHKLNVKSGAEEAGRELISGPSMFLIPMGIFEVIKRFAPTAKLTKETMHDFYGIAQNILRETGSDSDLNAKNYPKLVADKVFDKAFAGMDVTKEQKDRFIEILNRENVSNKASRHKRLGDLEQLVSEIKNSQKVAQTDAKNIKIGSGLSPKELIEDFTHFRKDVLENFSLKDFMSKPIAEIKAEGKKYLEESLKLRKNIRLRGAILSYLSVGGFLLYLPRLYQRGSTSPAEDSARRAMQEGMQEMGGVYANS